MTDAVQLPGAVLIANRGEIAVRIIGTLRRMGVGAVAVYSDADRDAPHVRLADAAIRLGPASPTASYLDVDRVVAAAGAADVDAVHPGYGFLSENPALPRACAAAGLLFIGPPADVIETMGDKARARQVMRDAGVPVVPGTDDGDLDDAALLAVAADLGPPLMVKPVAGGGGKGMSVVDDLDRLPGALRAARRQAASAFGDDRVLLERFVAQPRHIEVQVLADDHGSVVHLGERECSLQRRHQKIVEEAPSPLLDASTRAAIGTSAVAAARACGYRGAGTVEYIVSATRPDTFHFLEMNTRLQVEHPVTELITGLDLVEWQVRIAAGTPLSFRQDQITMCGHAIEARVYAEDPARDFLPTGGTVAAYAEPNGEGVRVDSGVRTGTTVPSVYDPLLAKIIACGSDRPAALRRLRLALERFAVLGMHTNTGFLHRLLGHPAVAAGDIDTQLVGRLTELSTSEVPDHVLVAAALTQAAALERAPVHSVFDLPGGWRIGAPAWTPLRLVSERRRATVAVHGRSEDATVRIDDGVPRPARATSVGDAVSVEFDGVTRTYRGAVVGDVIWMAHRAEVWALRRHRPLAEEDDAETRGGPVVAPMPGAVTAVHVRDGETVVAGQPLIVLEAMKMEHQLVAPADGVVRHLSVKTGDQVEMERTLLSVEASDADRPAD